MRLGRRPSAEKAAAETLAADQAAAALAAAEALAADHAAAEALAAEQADAQAEAGEGPDGDAPIGEVAHHSRLERAKIARARAEARVLELRRAAESRRAESALIDVAFSSYETDTRAGGGVLAGAVAFRIFLFQVPYVFVLVTIFSPILPPPDPTQSRLNGIAAMTASAMTGSSNTWFWAWLSSLLVGLFALFLGSRGAVKVLRIVHALVWGVSISKNVHPTRSAAAFIGVVSVGIGISAAVSFVRTETWLVSFALLVVSNAVVGVLWVYVSLHLPHKADCGWRDMVPGAAVLAVGLLALHALTVFWVEPSFKNKSETYGAVGASLALLFWAYAVGRLIVGTAIVNRSQWQVRRSRATVTPADDPDEPTLFGGEA